MIATRESFKVGARVLTVLALVLSLTAACITEPDTVDNDSSNVIVEIVSMGGQSVDDEGPADTAADLFSDVCFAPAGTELCSVFNDNGVVTLRAFPKDRAQLVSAINNVTFERYRVTYIRTDGRNVQGVDVPYPFDGVANFNLPVGGEEVERGFIVVRHQAKLEPPLVQLKQVTSDGGGGGGLILSTIAQIEFFGHDNAGRSVKVTGYLNVVFANFGNS